MERKWTTLLAMALLVPVLACSFSVDLGSESQASPAAHVPAPVVPSPTRTRVAPSPTPRAPSRDEGYELCLVEILEGLDEWNNDLVLVYATGRDDAKAFCVEFVKLRLNSGIQDLGAAHQDCPSPSDPGLQRAKEHLDQALAHYNEAADLFWEYCGQPALLSDESLALFAQAVDQQVEAGGYLDQAFEEIAQHMGE